MTMHRMTPQQHKDILDYLLYLRDIMFLNDWQIELSELYEEVNEDWAVASVLAGPLKKEACIKVTHLFFKDSFLEHEWSCNRTLYLIHEMTHLLMKDLEWITQTSQYDQFLPPAMSDFHSNNILRSLERTVEATARIISRFAKPFEWTKEEMPDKEIVGADNEDT